MEIVKNLQEQISKGRDEFNDCIIIIKSAGGIFTRNSFNHINNLHFNQCTFKGNYLELNSIYQPNLGLRFNDCSFDCEISIEDCIFQTLVFRDTQKIKSINISSGTYENLYFRNTQKIKIYGDIKITKNLILNSLKLENLNHGGEFEVSLKNDYSIQNHQKLNSTFKNSTFENLKIEESQFGNESDFQKIEIKNEALFENCLFRKVYFRKAKFENHIKFHDCKFFNYAGFENCLFLEKNNITFSSCLFTSFPHFNNSKFKNFELKHVIFEKKASFDTLTVDTFSLYQVTFNQGVFFDELRINQIEKPEYIENLSSSEARVWRRSLRLIKQELQKSDNKIDYNRFKSYELAVYYKELTWGENFKDKFILWATKWSVGFEHDWRSGAIFTVLSGFIWYSILYRFEHAGSCNLNEVSNFFNGFYRFLLVTDFYSPFEERKYIDNGWAWPIFIIGKIFIAFGIYEMIQAFRKFKA